MRRGEGGAAWGIGGAWQCAVRTFDGEPMTCDALKPGRTATNTGEKERACAEAGWTKGIAGHRDRKSTRLNSSHQIISYAVFCLKKKNTQITGNVSERQRLLWWLSRRQISLHVGDCYIYNYIPL